MRALPGHELEHARKHAELRAPLSGAARDRIATGVHQALQELKKECEGYKKQLVLYEHFLMVVRDNVRRHELSAPLSSTDRDRATTEIFQALKKIEDDRKGVYILLPPGRCSVWDALTIKYPSVDEFLSWRTPHGRSP